MTLEEMKVIIDAETKPFRDELSKMQSQLNSATANVERQTSRIKSTIGGIKKALVGLGIGATLFKIGKDGISMASDLQEAQNVVDVAFGNMAYKCEAFAKTAIKQFGMSELSAKRTASTYMAMGKGIGLASDTASDMAIQLAARSADVASFFNISQEQAATKLKSVFTGETETLKDLGVVMTQANLKQYALSHGFNDNIEKMDQASLTMLRYKFVMDQLSLAEGDYARTSGSWANQVRLLQEQWKQLLGIIGNGLIAIFTPVIRVLNTIIGKIIQFAQVVQAVFSSLFGKKGKESTDNTKKMSSSLGSAADGASGLNSQLDKTNDKAKKAAKSMGQLASFDEINNMNTSSSGGDSESGGGASIGGIDAGRFDWGLDDEADTSGIDKTIKKIKVKIEELKKFLEEYRAPIVSIMAGIVAGLGTLWMIRNWGSLIAPISSVFNWLTNLMKVLAVGPAGWKALITSALGVSAPMAAVVVAVAAVTAALVYLWQTSDTFRANVTKAVGSIMDIVQSFYSGVLVPLFSFLKDVFITVLVPIGVFLADVVVTAVDLVATVVLSLWNNVLAPIAKFLVNVLSIALKGVIEIWNAWKPAIQTVYAAIQGIWDGVLKPIVEWIKGYFTSVFQEFGDFINYLIPYIEDIFKGLIDFFVGVFTGDTEKAWSGIRKIYETFSSFLSDIFETDWSKSFGILGEVLNTFLLNVKIIWDTIKNVFREVNNFINSVFKGDWQSAWNSVKNIFKSVWDGIHDIVKKVWDKILGLFSKGGKIFSGVVDGIADVFKKIVNLLIDGINKVISWPFNKINGFLNDIRDIHIPLLGEPFSGLWPHNPLPVPQIPKLARGMIADSPTLGVFGEAGKEAVLPLENNTGWMSKIAMGISEKMNGGLAGDLNDLIILIQELIDVVREKDTSVYVGLDDDDIDRSNRKAKKLRELRTG